MEYLPPQLYKKHTIEEDIMVRHFGFDILPFHSIFEALHYLDY